MKRIVKIPRGLASVVVSERETTETGYNVNRLIRAVDFYLCLKSESHKIHNYTKQMEYLQRLCKCSRATFYNRLWAARDLGLLKIEDNRHISLTSWEKAGNILGYNHKEFYSIQYDTDKPEQTLRYFIIALEIEENRERQVHAIGKKLAANPDIEADYLEYCNRENIQAPFSLDNFCAVKQRVFASGTESNLYDRLHSFNPSLHRNIKSLAEAHGLSNWQGFAYIKHQLFLRGMVDIVRQTPTYCKYKDTPKTEFTKKGSTKFGRYYNNIYKTVLWYQPDAILLNRSLFSPEITPVVQSETPEKHAA